MSRKLFIPLILFAGFSTNSSCSQTPAKNPTELVFVASSPCGTGSRPLPGIPVNADCEWIKWNLRFSGDVTHPTTYKLNYTWGMTKQGTTEFMNGGTTVIMQGKWSVSKGITTDPEAIVYILDPDKPATSIQFVKLSDQLLHLLDKSKRLMVGSPAWSYTLNREQH
jgi:hypothetical protein